MKMFKQIRKKYQKYSGYSEDFDGNISKISFYEDVRLII